MVVNDLGGLVLTLGVMVRILPVWLHLLFASIPVVVVIVAIDVADAVQEAGVS